MLERFKPPLLTRGIVCRERRRRRRAIFRHANHPLIPPLTVLTGIRKKEIGGAGVIRSAARAARSRARGYRNMVKFERFQKRFPQSAHKQEYRGGGCGDRGVRTSTPYLVPAPPTSPSFAPNPNS